MDIVILATDSLGDNLNIDHIITIMKKYYELQAKDEVKKENKSKKIISTLLLQKPQK